MKKNRKNNILDWLRENQTAEQKAESDAYWERFWDNYDEEEAQSIYDNYGKEGSHLLKEIKEAGFNPIAITVMLCEETFVFETEEETKKAADKFLPEGWWYEKEDFKKSRIKYVEDAYKGIEENAPKVYWLK